jgi:hypothetical protein
MAMTLQEMIDVMTAYQNGAEIEMEYKEGNKWVDCTNPHWEWGTLRYRVKPKSIHPRELKNGQFAKITEWPATTFKGTIVYCCANLLINISDGRSWFIDRIFLDGFKVCPINQQTVDSALKILKGE